MRNTLNSASITASEPFRLPTGSLTVMALVSANPGSSQSDLAVQAGITGPSLVGIVDALEKQGMITRVRSEQDRRRNMLVLTEQGERTMQKLFSQVNGIEDSIRAELSEQELRQFTALLDRAIGALVKAKG